MALDNDGGIANLALPDINKLSVTHRSDILGGINVINGLLPSGRRLTAIPYYAWGHRGVGAMAVWLPRS